MRRSATVLITSLVTALLLAATWQGCASRRATRVSVSHGRLDFGQRYEIAKYLISTGQLENAGRQVKQLERKAKTNVQKAMLYDTKASLHMARHEFVSAEEDATKAIRAFPSLASGYKVRALARGARGNLPGAVEDFKSALVLLPNDTESLRGLADIFISQNEILEAANVLEQFLTLDSLDVQAQDAWCNSMASILGYARFPIEYLRALRTGAVTRGELAAVLVVELEMARLEAKYDSQIQKQRNFQSSPSVSDCDGFWFAPFVEKAVRLELLHPYPDGTFRPGDTVRKGILALELYSFLNLNCKDALAEIETGVEKPARDTKGSVEQNPRLNASLTHRSPRYPDVDDSSYLWRPVVAVTELGLMKPSSSQAFGVDHTLSGEEVRAIAKDLAGLTASGDCAGGR